LIFFSTKQRMMMFSASGPILKHVLPFCLMVVLGTGMAERVQADVIDIATLGRYLKTFTSLSGSFTQENFDAFQQKKTSASGSFRFKKPGLMKWTYQTPDPLTIILGKQRLWIYDPILENVTIKNIKDISPTEQLSFLINPENLERLFQLATPSRSLLDQPTRFHTLYLRPQTKTADFSVLHLAFAGDDYRLNQFVLEDAAGGYRKITFSETTYDLRLDDSEFDFVIPEGTEIIDETGEHR